MVGGGGRAAGVQAVTGPSKSTQAVGQLRGHSVLSLAALVSNGDIRPLKGQPRPCRLRAGTRRGSGAGWILEGRGHQERPPEESGLVGQARHQTEEAEHSRWQKGRAVPKAMPPHPAPTTLSSLAISSLSSPLEQPACEPLEVRDIANIQYKPNE